MSMDIDELERLWRICLAHHGGEDGKVIPIDHRSWRLLYTDEEGRLRELYVDASWGVMTVEPKLKAAMPFAAVVS